jgi:DNA replication and repair protein RecF
VRLERLKLRDFRNYAKLDISFPPGIILLSGLNGAGKSNLLEAVHFLSYLKSFRTTRDREVVRFSQPFAAVEARFVGDTGRPFEARLVLKSGKRHVRLDGSDVTRFQDFIGRLHSQFFFPGDLSLLTGDPAYRREVLDLELMRLKPLLTPVFQRYQQALKERNRILKLLHPRPGETARDSERIRKMLAVYTEQLVVAGTQLMRERRGLTRVLNEQFNPLYGQLAPPGGEAVSLEYSSGVELEPDEQVREAFATRLEEAAEAEASLRYTSVGPHRDDLLFILNGKRDLKRFGSQGQQRSAVLAFRLALCNLSAQRLGDRPVLLLDDALSEMDDARKERLLKICQRHSQVFITSASAREIELIRPLAQALYQVEHGEVRLVEHPGS